jgi:hypothetical protein
VRVNVQQMSEPILLETARRRELVVVTIHKLWDL